MYSGKSINEIETPALVIDFDRLKSNIEKMNNFLKQTNCSLRPHFKTHKCVAIAKMQIRSGATGITCAKLGEAEVLANSGVDNILVANQIVDPDKIMRLAGLAKYSDITVAVDSISNVDDLSRAAVCMRSRLGILIEADTGMGRCGVRSHEDALKLAEKIALSPGLLFRGIMGYEGHCVFTEKFEERSKKASDAINTLLGYKDHLEAAGYKIGIVSCGGTGTYNVSSKVPGITEIQAGSYVFMDTRYRSIEGIDFENALFLMATVISVPEKGIAVTDSGMKCLTQEFGLPKAVSPAGVELIKLAEEHGKFSVDSNICSINAGDRIMIMPSHGCTTVNLHDRYYVASNDIVTGIWNVDARGKFV